MSETTSSPAGDSGSSPEISIVESAYVQFADAAASESVFSDAPPSEWAFAGYAASTEGEAIDAVAEISSDGLPPVAAVVALIAADLQFDELSLDPLIASTASPRSADADQGMIMWSGEDLGETIDTPMPTEREVLTLHDFVNHGVSVDWTDHPFLYS
jgi:hypothetical protein